MVTAAPDVRSMPRHARDELLVLACDGIWDVISSSDAVAFVKTCLETVPGVQTPKPLAEVTLKEALDAAGALTDHCLDAGSRDNMTAAVVVFTGRKDPPQAAASVSQTRPRVVARLADGESLGAGIGQRAAWKDVPVSPPSSNGGLSSGVTSTRSHHKFWRGGQEEEERLSPHAVVRKGRRANRVSHKRSSTEGETSSAVDSEVEQATGMDAEEASQNTSDVSWEGSQDATDQQPGQVPIHVSALDVQPPLGSPAVVRVSSHLEAQEELFVKIPLPTGADPRPRSRRVSPLVSPKSSSKRAGAAGSSSASAATGVGFAPRGGKAGNRTPRVDEATAAELIDPNVVQSEPRHISHRRRARTDPLVSVQVQEETLPASAPVQEEDDEVDGFLQADLDSGSPPVVLQRSSYFGLTEKGQSGDFDTSLDAKGFDEVDVDVLKQSRKALFDLKPNDQGPPPSVPEAEVHRPSRVRSAKPTVGARRGPLVGRGPWDERTGQGIGTAAAGKTNPRRARGAYGAPQPPHAAVLQSDGVLGPPTASSGTPLHPDPLSFEAAHRRRLTEAKLSDALHRTLDSREPVPRSNSNRSMKAPKPTSRRYSQREPTPQSAAPLVSSTGGVAREHMIVHRPPTGDTSTAGWPVRPPSSETGDVGSQATGPRSRALRASPLPQFAPLTTAGMSTGDEPMPMESADALARARRNPTKALPMPLMVGTKGSVGATAAMLAQSSAAVAISAAREAYKERMATHKASESKAPSKRDSSMFWGLGKPPGGEEVEVAQPHPNPGAFSRITPLRAEELPEGGSLSFQGPIRGAPRPEAVPGSSSFSADLRGRLGRGNGPSVRWGGAALPGQRYPSGGLNDTMSAKVLHGALHPSGRGSGPRTRYQ
jgi:hypothetical protein